MLRAIGEMKEIAVNFRIPKELSDRLNEATRQLDLTKSWIIRKSLEKFLEELETMEDKGIARLIAEGVIRSSRGGKPGLGPKIKLPGKPVSEIIIEDRRE